MQALKGLVAGMAIMIVAGMILLVYGLYQKAQDPSFSFFGKGPAAATTTAPASPPPAAAASTPAKPFGAMALALPAGATLRNLYTAEGRVIAHVAVPGEAERLLVLDPASGALIGQWSLGPPP